MNQTKGLKEVLLRPIPDQTGPLALKKGYRSYPLLPGRVGDNGPLVNIADYGIAGQSYYSRHNPVTRLPVEGVPVAVYLRENIVRLLADINTSLQQTDVVTELLGGEVELFVQEGWRSAETQAYLYEVVFPRLIREQNPGISDAEMRRRRSDLIAVPTRNQGSPSPHETGAAIDVALRYSKPDLGYTPKSIISMGHKSGSTDPTAMSDYYEHKNVSSAEGLEL
jgi:D-alanyl-D-alanine dipeptidase